MVELLQPVVAEPTAVYERTPGVLEIHELRPREAAIVRVQVPRDQIPGVLAQALVEVERRMDEAGVVLGGPPFARYLSFDPAAMVAEFGFPVLRPAPRVGRVEPSTLPGGPVASVIHLGPYATIEVTWDRLRQDLDDLGLHPSGPMWEVYWTDPETEPGPGTWRTELLVPVR